MAHENDTIIFAIGAGFGGVISGIIGIKTIWISVVILLIVINMMVKEVR